MRSWRACAGGAGRGCVPSAMIHAANLPREAVSTELLNEPAVVDSLLYYRSRRPERGCGVPEAPTSANSTWISAG
jgi:hypothetical protein